MTAFVSDLREWPENVRSLRVEQTLQLRAPVATEVATTIVVKYGQLLGKRRCLQWDLLVSGLSD
jgi:hypothetical protein